MFKIKVIDYFSAAHNLRNYKGKCEDLHGHNYKVEVVINGKELDEDGLLVDFKDVKASLKKVLSLLDHKYLNELQYFVGTNPTSENLAKYVYNELKELLQLKIDSVTIWETGSSAATYCE
jgi:6-pyruvoyltetrahydropterin/6-carboxytetrahydropterin synthase